jgi:hypothetical protein
MSNIEIGNWVVSSNPLHADNGVGLVQQVRNEQAKVECHPAEAGDKETIRWQP